MTWEKREPLYKMDSTEWTEKIRYGENKEKTARLYIKKKPNWKEYYWQMFLGMRLCDRGSTKNLKQAKIDAKDAFNCKALKKCDKK